MTLGRGQHGHCIAQATKALSLAVFAALCSSHAYAQQAAAPAGEEEPTTLATMTVTAQKREEAMQDVPIAVTAISEQLLQDTGVRDIKDLQVLAARHDGDQHAERSHHHGAYPRYRHRRRQRGPESSVGVVIDGVYRPRNSVGFGDLGQLERIEVLKGPQGTVFGKNTSAGVINVVTRRPSYTQSAEGEVTVANYGGLACPAATTMRSAKRRLQHLRRQAQARRLDSSLSYRLRHGRS